jgi:hypothetical protein
MWTGRTTRAGVRGATLSEFVVAAAVWLMLMVSVVAGAHLFYTHNAQFEATRRGARYAVLHDAAADPGAIRNVVAYGTPSPAAGAQPFVPGLDPTRNVTVEPVGLGVAQGRVRLGIQNYKSKFVVPFITVTLDMPAYNTTMAGECGGQIPEELPE